MGIPIDRHGVIACVRSAGVIAQCLVPLPTDPEELKACLLATVRVAPSVWFETGGRIQKKGGAVIKPRANFLQRQINDVIVWCLLHERPCRIIILKPRQKGCSTFSVASVYHRLSGMNARGCIIGGAHKQGENLFKMLKLYAEHDDFAAGNKCRVVEGKAKWPIGSECVQETARNPEAGRSGTYEVLLATEVARWAEEGVANAADVLAGLLKCVPDLEKTLVILESTACGASGDFYDRYQGAITFEELKSGKDGFVKIFAPWFAFEDSAREPEKEGIGSEEDLSELERELAAEHGLSLAQVAWMRWAIREECRRDFDTFCQDYPFDAQTAFLTSGRRRFNAGMVRRMLDASRLVMPQFGSLDEQGRGQYVWRPVRAEEARVMKWEPPLEGCRYVLAIDPMTGISQTGGKDPDNHSALVVRAGFLREGRGWMAPKIVARLIGDWPLWEREKKYELRWDIDVLEEQVWRLAQYYGNCLIAPEMNMDRGLVELLKLRRSARIYQREIFNRREQTLDKALGWLTDNKTREMGIENLARAVRERGHEGEGVDIPCPIVLSEMLSFVVKDSGRSEAMAGKHDDNVLALAIALMCENGATRYSEPLISVPLPPDLRRLEKEMAGSEKKGLATVW